MQTHIFSQRIIRIHGYLMAFMASLLLVPAYAQVITTNQTATTLAQALTGPGVSVSNAQLVCPGSFNGTFTGGSGNLGIQNGILLTSGMASAVTLPTLQFPGIDPGSYMIGDFDPSSEHSAGDATLDALNNHPTLDACVLEFDFVPLGDTISFKYQFGSEEYTAFTCSPFNDIFGFFLSGPGITGTVNIARVPGTNVPVAINTVNGGSTLGDFYNITNCTSLGYQPAFQAYFIDNRAGTSVGYDGLTTVLTATSPVQACATYHLKLAIADATDRLLSSGVFLQQGSLISAKPIVLNCPGNITASGPCGAYVTWSPPTTTSTCSTITTVTSNRTPGSFFPTGTTPVTYTFTNAAGSTTCTFNVIVTASGTPASCSIGVAPSNNTYTGGIPTNIYIGYGPQSATLTDNVVGGTSFTYAWTGPTSKLSCTDCKSPVFTPTVAGLYTFNVTATSNTGCVASCSKTFCVKDIRVASTNCDNDDDDDDYDDDDACNPNNCTTWSHHHNNDCDHANCTSSGHNHSYCHNSRHHHNNDCNSSNCTNYTHHHNYDCDIPNCNSTNHNHSHCHNPNHNHNNSNDCNNNNCTNSSHHHNNDCDAPNCTVSSHNHAYCHNSSHHHNNDCNSIHCTNSSHHHNNDCDNANCHNTSHNHAYCHNSSHHHNNDCNSTNCTIYSHHHNYDCDAPNCTVSSHNHSYCHNSSHHHNNDCNSNHCTNSSHHHERDCDVANCTNNYHNHNHCHNASHNHNHNNDCNSSNCTNSSHHHSYDCDVPNCQSTSHSHSYCHNPNHNHGHSSDCNPNNCSNSSHHHGWDCDIPNCTNSTHNHGNCHNSNHHHDNNNNCNNSNYKVYLCHRNSCNSSNSNTIAVSINSVAAHLTNHSGDQLGQCGQPCGPQINAKQIAGGEENNAPIFKDDFEVKASPNPFSNSLHVMFKSNTIDVADITVSDMTGRKIEMKNAVTVGTDIVLGGTLPSGVYIIDVRHGDVSKQIKVVKAQ